MLRLGPVAAQVYFPSYTFEQKFRTSQCRLAVCGGDVRFEFQIPFDGQQLMLLVHGEFFTQKAVSVVEQLVWRQRRR